MRNVPMLVDLDVRFRVMDALRGLPADPVAADAADRGDGARAPTRSIWLEPPTTAWRSSCTVIPHGSPGSSLRCRWTIPAAAVAELDRAIGDARRARHPDVHATSTAARSPRPSCCRSSRRWPATTCRSGCTPTAGRPRPTTRRRIARNTKSGGRSAGRTTPASRWRGIVFAGYFDRFPALKIITHHMGAMAPYFAGRVGPGWDQLGARTSDAGLRRGAATAEEAARWTTSRCSTRTRRSSARTTRRSAASRSSAPTASSSPPTPRSTPRGGPMYIRETIGIVDRLADHRSRAHAYLLGERHRPPQASGLTAA